VFLVGAPRSGTTWLQQLLGAHPGIATPQETDLLDLYVASWLKSWQLQLASSLEPGHRARGLPTVLTEEQFLNIIRGVLDKVYGTVLEHKPGATVVLDKNPYHSYHVAQALRLLPQAGLIHLIRDGRDVACSLMRAAERKWGRGWAPTHVDGAAALWRNMVETVRAGAGDRYVEVRYEELCAGDPPQALVRLYGFCGIDADEALARAALDRFDLDRLRSTPAAEQPSSIVWAGEAVASLGGPPAEPEGFVGGGGAGGWAERFSPYDRWLFDRVAGDLLLDLGYEPDRSWVGIGTAGRAQARGRHLAARASYRARRLLPG
jgi:Sulfotransferase family